MKLLMIAARVVARTAAMPELADVITPEVKEQFGIDPDAEPSEFGSNSAVFETSRGTVVSFVWQERAWQVAKKAMGRFEDLLPKVLDVQKVFDPAVDEPVTPDLDKMDRFDRSPIYAIEMEKLRPLNRSEWDGFEDPSALADLEDRMSKAGVTHGELDTSNVAWAPDGSLKLIDFYDIMFEGAPPMEY